MLLTVGRGLRFDGPSGGRAGAAPECSPKAPCLAIVIDDIGRDLDALDQLLEIDAPLTFSLLPHAVHTRRAIERLRALGRDYMLHLPMLPHDRQQITDEPVVLGGVPSALPAQLAECFARVPGARGVNNHMGSAMSERPELVETVLRAVKRRGLWFLDSKTTAETTICEVGARVGVACRRRDLFLDDPPRAATVKERLAGAVSLARREGSAVAIGHPLEPTVRILRKYLKSVKEEVSIVSLSGMMDRRRKTPSPAIAKY